ncbi:MAG: hypothetical protein CM15mV52_0030 [uncultured marine virus]|nr:MAG: hypothetical protein CM15mV52_0030 [uncultured marine virus]
MVMVRLMKKKTGGEFLKGPVYLDTYNFYKIPDLEKGTGKFKHSFILCIRYRWRYEYNT